MSEATPDDALAALRMQGAHACDPVRFRYLEAMAERMKAQSESVRSVLARRFEEALTDYRSLVERAQEASCRPAQAALPAFMPSALARLNQEIGERVKGGASELMARDGGGMSGMSGLGDDPIGLSEMKSVRRFAEVWSKIATERQLSQALTRGPELAGPLNSHNLVLRAMSLMHGLSPSYLRRFLSQGDALLCLAHMNQQNALKDGKTAARRGRAKKS